MLLRLIAVSFLGLLLACTGENEKAQEPVSADVDDEDSDEDSVAEGHDRSDGQQLNTENGSGDAAAGTAAARGEDGEFWLVDAPKLNVRKGPGSNFAVSRTLKKGEQVQPLECENNWCKIGTEEYVAQKFLSR